MPFELVHRNERDAGVTAASGGDTPCVRASVEARPGYLTLLGPVDLERAGGDVRRFEELLLAAAAAHGLSLGAGRARADQ